MPPHLTHRRRVAAKIEAAEGVAESLTTAEGTDLLFESPTFSIEPEKEPRNPSRASFSPLPGTIGKRSSRFSGLMQMKGAGTAATAPAWAKLLNACGFSETNIAAATIGNVMAYPDNGDTSNVTVEKAGTYSGSVAAGYIVEVTTGGESASAKVTISDVFGNDSVSGEQTVTTATPINLGANGATITFTFTGSLTLGDRWFVLGYPVCKQYKSATIKSGNSLTIGLWDDGTKHVMPGSRGNVSFNFTDGKCATMQFEFQGGYVAPVAEALLDVTDDSKHKSPVFLSANLHIGSYKAIVSELTLDAGTALTARADCNEADGILSFAQTGRNATGRVNPEKVTPTVNDFFGHLVAGKTFHIGFRIGSQAGNMFQVLLSIQYNNMEDEDNEGIALLGAPFDCVALDQVGDSEIMIFAI